MKFVAMTTGYGKVGAAGPGFQSGTATRAERPITILICALTPAARRLGYE